MTANDLLDHQDIAADEVPAGKVVTSKGAAALAEFLKSGKEARKWEAKKDAEGNPIVDPRTEKAVSIRGFGWSLRRAIEATFKDKATRPVSMKIAGDCVYIKVVKATNGEQPAKSE